MHIFLQTPLYWNLILLKIILLLNVEELAAHCSKASAREARLVGRKVCFTLEARWRGGGWTPAQRPAPHWQGKSFKGDFRGAQAKEGPHAGKPFSAWRCRLTVGHQWSDQCRLGCFTYSQSSVPGPSVFYFSESSSGIVAAYVVAAVGSSYS